MSMKDALDNFNSTMVRLKAAYRIIMQSLEGNFNSTMVRLKALVNGFFRIRFIISIPLWYD